MSCTYALLYDGYESLVGNVCVCVCVCVCVFTQNSGISKNFVLNNVVLCSPHIFISHITVYAVCNSSVRKLYT